MAFCPLFNWSAHFKKPSWILSSDDIQVRAPPHAAWAMRMHTLCARARAHALRAHAHARSPREGHSALPPCHAVPPHAQSCSVPNVSAQAFHASPDALMGALEAAGTRLCSNVGWRSLRQHRPTSARLCHRLWAGWRLWPCCLVAGATR